MTTNLRYYASLQSPWTYLGHDRLYEIAARYNVTVACKPVDFGRIFSVSGGLPLGQRAAQRQAYRLVDLARWAGHLNIPLNLHPKFFPAAEQSAARMVTSLGLHGGDAGALAGAILHAVWSEEKDIGDESVLLALADGCGLDGAALLAGKDQAEIISAFDAQTDEAIELGVFGAPTYEIDGELFWGQDRLELLDRALAAL